MFKYKYDEEFYFVCKDEAFKNPVASQKLGKDIYFLSPNSTFTEPPVIEDPAKLARYNKLSDSWDIVDDMTGKWVLNLETNEIIKNTKRYIPDGWREASAEEVEEYFKPPEKTAEEIIKEYEDAVQNHLDKTAQSRDYDNTYTCLSYLNSTNEKWYRESHAFNSWRDGVWVKCHEILNSYMTGKIPQPTVEELIYMLPGIDWNDPVPESE